MMKYSNQADPLFGLNSKQKIEHALAANHNKMIILRNRVGWVELQSNYLDPKVKSDILSDLKN